MTATELIMGDKLKGIFGDEKLFLVAADTDRIQSYVFESAKLTEMRGASLILDLLNVKDDDDPKWGEVEVPRGLPQLLKNLGIPEEALVYKGGGGASFILPESRVAEVTSEIEKLYTSTTLSVTTTVVSVPRRLPDPAALRAKARLVKGEAWRLLKANLVDESEWRKCHSPDDLSDDQFNRAQRFGWLQRAASYKLRRQKLDKPTAPVFEVSPFTERCSYCGFRPAERLANEVDEQPICKVCRFKRQDQGGRRERFAHSFYLSGFSQYLHDELDQRKNEPSKQIPNYFCRGANPEDFPIEKAYELLNTWHEIESPRSLEDVAAAGSGKTRNFIGVIYADGNNMGAMLDSFATDVEFKSFAKKVRVTMECALFSGLGCLLNGVRESEYPYRTGKKKKAKRTYRHHPFEIITIGGDDVYLFVPADVALELALHMCERFEQEFQGKLTLAAGVLIAHKTTPIHFSRSVVKGLLKNAKKLSKAGDTPQSAIDFQVITADTAVSEEIAEFRKQAYRSRVMDETLTTRPLTLKQLENLIHAIRKMKVARFPKTQLYALREALVRGPKPRATNFYAYQQARNSYDYRPLHEFLDAGRVAIGGDDQHLPFWVKKQAGRVIETSTPLVDLVEIYDFVRDKQAGEEQR